MRLFRFGLKPFFGIKTSYQRLRKAQIIKAGVNTRVVANLAQRPDMLGGIG
jgi:hypothetical protein